MLVRLSAHDPVNMTKNKQVSVLSEPVPENTLGWAPGPGTLERRKWFQKEQE